MSNLNGSHKKIPLGGEHMNILINVCGLKNLKLNHEYVFINIINGGSVHAFLKHPWFKLVYA